jgi:hypothetical protein
MLPHLGKEPASSSYAFDVPCKTANSIVGEISLIPTLSFNITDLKLGFFHDGYEAMKGGRI